MKTASTEREAIVAWLRTKNLVKDSYVNRVALQTCLTVADAIERGDHLKDQDHGRA